MLFQNRREKRISLVVIATLVFLTWMAGFLVYGAVRNHAESVYGRSLQLELESRVRLIEYEVRQHLATTLALRKKPEIREQLESLVQTPATAASEALEASLHAGLSEGFSALIMYDRQGVQIASVGRAIPSNFDQLLQLPQDTYLGWQDGYIVSTRIEIRNGGRKLGTLVAQSRVSEITGITSASRSAGQETTLALCALGDNKALRCIPTPKAGKSVADAPKLDPLIAAMSSFQVKKFMCVRLRMHKIWVSNPSTKP